MGDVADRGPDPLRDQPLHHVAEPGVDLTDEVAVRDEDVVEEQLGGVGLGLADLVELAAPLEARHAGLDHEQA